MKRAKNYLPRSLIFNIIQQHWTNCFRKSLEATTVQYIVPDQQLSFETDFFLQFAQKTSVFISYRVLRLSNGLNEPGPVNWDLALCLLLAWIICYLCVSRGVKTSSKVSKHLFCVRPSSYDVLLSILFEKNSVTSQNLKSAKLWDWLAYSETTIWIQLLSKNQPVSENW